jgi:hypothetical protein
MLLWYTPADQPSTFHFSYCTLLDKRLGKKEAFFFKKNTRRTKHAAKLNRHWRAASTTAQQNRRGNKRNEAIWLRKMFVCYHQSCGGSS